jgi:hypothetical protein
MITTIIYSLQGFHIHYEMYTMIRRLEILLSLLLFSYFTGFFLFNLKEIMRGYLNEIFQPFSFLFFRVYSWPNKRKNFSIQDNIFQVRKEDINLNIYKFQIQLQEIQCKKIRFWAALITCINLNIF